MTVTPDIPTGLSLDPGSTTLALEDLATTLTSAVSGRRGGTYLETVLADSPAGYWRLGEPSGTVADDEISTNNGTYVNTPTLGATGLILDSNTSVTLTAAQSEEVTIPGNSLSTNGTFECWFKWSTNTRLIRDSTSGASGGWLLGFDSAGTFKVRVAATDITTSITTAAARDGTTHHLVVTKAAAEGRIYLDGVQVGTSSALANTASVNPWHIGRDGVGAGYCDASFDEIAIYPAALTPTQVATHHSIGVSGGVSTLIGGETTLALSPDATLLALHDYLTDTTVDPRTTTLTLDG